MIRLTTCSHARVLASHMGQERDSCPIEERQWQRVKEGSRFVSTFNFQTTCHCCLRIWRHARLFPTRGSSTSRSFNRNCQWSYPRAIRRLLSRPNVLHGWPSPLQSCRALSTCSRPISENSWLVSPRRSYASQRRGHFLADGVLAVTANHDAECCVAQSQRWVRRNIECHRPGHSPRDSSRTEQYFTQGNKRRAEHRRARRICPERASGYHAGDC